MPSRFRVKDEGGLRNAGEEVVVEVPRLANGTLGTPIAVYEAVPRSSVDSLPRLLARPRSTVIFGADSLMPVYIEAVGPQAPASVDVRVVGGRRSGALEGHRRPDAARVGAQHHGRGAGRCSSASA